MPQAYANHESGLIHNSHAPRFGDVRYLEIEHKGNFFHILVKVIDARIVKGVRRCEVVPVASDNACLWVDSSDLMELVDPTWVNRES